MHPFLLVTIKLLIGFFAMVTTINLSGKGNLAPSSASDQIVNYVLGGIIGGVIYSNTRFYCHSMYLVYTCSKPKVDKET